MKYLAMRVAVAAITFIAGVGATSMWLMGRWQPDKQETRPTSIPPPAAVARHAPAADPDGLLIPGMSQSVITKSRQRYRPQEFKNIYITTFETKGYVLAAFALNGRQENGEAISGEPRQLGVHSITRYDVGGRPFCYQILGNVPGLGVLISYDYYDDDGDGKFDRCVSGTWPGTPAFPKWILLEN
jgi:hypothetical protein